jgi:two-component system response regulator HydG
LQTTIENAAIGSRAPLIIQPTDLPPELLWPAKPAQAAPVAGPDGEKPGPLNPRHREHIIAALARAGGNRAEASRLLGISRTTLYRRLRELGLETGSDVD